MMADGKNDTALGLGERLRSARKARALTLEQAAFTLRLEASVLRALEDERYDVLGAAVFVRGHLKAYAKLLGLSEEAVLAAYRAADPNADTPPKVTRELEKPLTTTPGPLAIVAAVVFLLLAMWLLYSLGAGKDPAPPSGQPLLEVTPPAEPAAAADPASVPVAPQAMNGAPQAMNGAPQAMNGAPQAMNGAPQAVNAAPQSVDVVPPATAVPTQPAGAEAPTVPASAESAAPATTGTFE